MSFYLDFLSIEKWIHVVHLPARPFKETYHRLALCLLKKNQAKNFSHPVEKTDHLANSPTWPK